MDLRGCIKVNLFTKLAEVYKDYETKIEAINYIDYFVIVNPFGNNNILVSEEGGINLIFSSTSAHFNHNADANENVNDLIKCINEFLNGKLVVLQFFKEDDIAFSGSRYLEDIDMSSGESLLESFMQSNGPFKASYEGIKGFNYRCLIRGWNNEHNQDFDFILK